MGAYDGGMRYAAGSVVAGRCDIGRGCSSDHRVADAHGRRRELSGLLLAPDPAAQLREARDSGDLVELLPAFAPSVGFDQRSRFHALPLDEHVFSVVEGVADQTGSLRLRLAALLHDIGKPGAAFLGDDGRVHYGGWLSAGVPSHEQLGAWITHDVMESFGYSDRLTAGVVELVRWHMPRERERSQAERLTARLGSLTHDLCVLRRYDALSKGPAGRSAALAPERDPRLALLEASATRLRH